ncbi:hypothetical protein GGS24DRAFT_482771 [Hypoxylon argillaceum]|nr:hypothetical protein GGS24DRAFT_482771 [Hypoxylon argillaceum]
MIPPILGLIPLIIGIINGIIGIVETSKNHYADGKGGRSMVRITVGLDRNHGLTGAGGDLPDVEVFNEFGVSLGKRTRPGKIKAGEYIDVDIKHNHMSTQQSPYALFGANNDAICIAMATITWPDGSQYGWMGDWGYKCGGTWYYSNIYVQPAGIKPRCLWIDGNSDARRTGFQVHWPEFAQGHNGSLPDTDEGKAAKARYLCTAGPPFTMTQQPNAHPKKLNFWVPKYGADGEVKDMAVAETRGRVYGQAEPTEEDLAARKRAEEPFMAHSLVVSDSEQHSAEELCGSPTSMGPDFFDARTGTFCRMADKTVWPACDYGTNTTDGCFNDVVNVLVINGVAARDEPYVSVIDWASGS